MSDWHDKRMARAEAWAANKERVKREVPASAKMMRILMRRSGASRQECVDQITKLEQWYCSACKVWWPFERFDATWRWGDSDYLTIGSRCHDCARDPSLEPLRQITPWSEDERHLLHQHAGKWPVDRFVEELKDRFGVERTRTSVICKLRHEGLGVMGGAEGFVSGKELGDLFGWHTKKVGRLRDLYGMPARSIAGRLMIYSIEGIMKWSAKSRPEWFDHMTTPDVETILAFGATCHSENDVETMRDELAWPPCFKIVQCTRWATYWDKNVGERDHRFFATSLYNDRVYCPACGVRCTEAAAAYTDQWTDGAHMTLDAFDLCDELPVHGGPDLFPWAATLVAMVGPGSTSGRSGLEIAGIAQHHPRRIRLRLEELKAAGLVVRAEHYTWKATANGRREAHKIRRDIETPDGLATWRDIGMKRPTP